MERSIEAIRPGGSSARPSLSKSPYVRGLIVVAALGAAVLGQWFDGVVILFLFFLGEFLHDKCLKRAGHFIRQLHQHVPDEMATRLLALLEDVPSGKSFSERFVAGVVQIYTPALVIVALLVAAVPPIFFGESFSPWIYRGLILLVLAGPSAFAFSVPVAVMATLNHGLKSGFLLRDSEIIERLATVDTILLDSTSTLTKEALHVIDILPMDGRTEAEVLAMAAGVEWASDHPIGSAIVAAALEAEVDLVHVSSVEVFPGSGARGTMGGRTVRVGNLRYLRRESVDVSGVRDRVERLEAEGKHVVGLADGLLLLGLIVLADVPEEESLRAVLRLQKIGGIERLEMISGSSEPATRWLAAQYGIHTVRAELLPEDKVRTVESLQRMGHQVAMVGDGVRDQAALDAADVGVAIGMMELDLASETAPESRREAHLYRTPPVVDVGIFRHDLSQLPYAVVLARRMVRILRQNMIWAMGIKALALLLLARGDLTLWMAGLMDTGVVVLVCINGMRLLRRIRLPSARIVRV